MPKIKIDLKLHKIYNNNDSDKILKLFKLYFLSSQNWNKGLNFFLTLLNSFNVHVLNAFITKHQTTIVNIIHLIIILECDNMQLKKYGNL